MVDTLVHSSSTHVLAGEGSNMVDILEFSFIEGKERSRDMRGTGEARAVLPLKSEGLGELPGRGETDGDHGDVGGLGGEDLQVVADAVDHGVDGGLVSVLKVEDHGAVVEAVLGEEVASEF